MNCEQKLDSILSNMATLSVLTRDIASIKKDIQALKTVNSSENTSALLTKIATFLGIE